MLAAELWDELEVVVAGSGPYYLLHLELLDHEGVMRLLGQALEALVVLLASRAMLHTILALVLKLQPASNSLWRLMGGLLLLLFMEDD